MSGFNKSNNHPLKQAQPSIYLSNADGFRKLKGENGHFIY